MDRTSMLDVNLTFIPTPTLQSFMEKWGRNIRRGTSSALKWNLAQIREELELRGMRLACQDLWGFIDPPCPFAPTKEIHEFLVSCNDPEPLLSIGLEDELEELREELARRATVPEWGSRFE